MKDFQLETHNLALQLQAECERLSRRLVRVKTVADDMECECGWDGQEGGEECYRCSILTALKEPSNHE